MCSSTKPHSSSNGATLGSQGSTSATGSSAASAVHSGGAMLSEMHGGMAEVLNQLDAARQILHTGGGKADLDLDMPGIAVIGGQSAGKTSVLELLSGISLPRGDGTVTRCPLELQLRCGDTEVAHLTYKDPADPTVDVKIENLHYKDIADAVDQATTAVAGPGKSIKDSPLSLKVYGPHLHDLTLIDLPGIIVAPLPGQPPNIRTIIEDMASNYIKGKSTVIACVVPATEDSANVTAWQLAQDHDPEGERTIGIFTKVDRAENHKAIRARIDGSDPNEFRPQLGVKAVKCRNTNNKDEVDMTLLELQQQEQAFFAEHPELRHVSGMGSVALANKLDQSQKDLLFSTDIDELLHTTKEELKPLTASTAIKTEAAAQRRTAQLLHQAGAAFVDLANADYERLTQEVPKELHVAPRTWDLDQEFASQIRHENPRSWYFDDACLTRITEESKETEGIDLPEFSSTAVFRSIFRTSAAMLQKPSATFVDDKCTYVRGVLHKLVQHEFAAFPQMQRVVLNKVDDILDAQAASAHTVMQTLIACEAHSNRVFTSSPNHARSLQRLKAALADATEADTSGAELQHDSQITFADFDMCGKTAAQKLATKHAGHKDISISLAAYLDVVLQGFCDNVPKISHQRLVVEVGATLVEANGVVDAVAEERDNALLPLLQNAEHEHKRAALEAKCQALKKASDALKNIV